LLFKFTLSGLKNPKVNISFVLKIKTRRHSCACLYHNIRS